MSNLMLNSWKFVTNEANNLIPKFQLQWLCNLYPILVDADSFSFFMLHRRFQNFSLCFSLSPSLIFHMHERESARSYGIYLKLMRKWVRESESKKASSGKLLNWNIFFLSLTQFSNEKLTRISWAPSPQREGREKIIRV